MLGLRSPDLKPKVYSPAGVGPGASAFTGPMALVGQPNVGEA